MTAVGLSNFGGCGDQRFYVCTKLLYTYISIFDRDMKTKITQIGVLFLFPVAVVVTIKVGCGESVTHFFAKKKKICSCIAI